MNRAELLRAITAARTGPEVADAVAALDAFDKRAVAEAAAGRELDMSASLVTARLTPLPAHEHHTAATDWLADLDTEPGDYRTAMISEASAWVRGLPPAVLADAEELAEQAHGRARTLASAHGAKRREAEKEFLSFVSYLARQMRAEGASGLPQIDQTIDPNNQPAPTPYPTEVFDNFAPPQNNYNGGVEDEAGGSQISSESAPLLQQVRQQDGSGSGFGSGPERPDQHSTQMDTSNSYSEVPPGQPGQIPTAPGGQPQAPSTPNPIAGSDQVADDNQLQQQMKQGAYTAPDAAGFRWVARAAEVLHPYHEKCGASHWPDEGCGHQEHTASMAVGYSMNLDDAHKLARCELVGAQEGHRVVQATGSLKALATHHNQVAAAWGDSDRTAEDTAVLHGFQAVVRPVLVTGDKESAGELGGRLDFKAAPGRHAREAGHATDDSDPSTERCPDCGHRTDTDCGCGCCTAGMGPKKGASSLTQIQQITDPNNAETPQADDLPDGVMFPLNPAFQGQWETGPGGAQPKGTAKEGARRSMTPSRDALKLFGRMDALEGKQPHHKDSYPFGANAHGTYARAYNNNRGVMDAMAGRDPIDRDTYSSWTGRADLHRHYMDAYNSARNLPAGSDGDVGYQVMSSRKTADTLTKPHETTDDYAAPYNSPQTTPDPFSSNAEPQDSDYQAGMKDGQADAGSGARPTFADNSSAVSQYVRGYAEGYGGRAGFPAAQPDVPHSLGGDSGQAANAQEAGQAFQVAKASRQVQARDFSEAERDEATKEGDAIHGKLPIKNKTDLKNAEHLKGHVKGVPKAEVDSYMKRKEHEFGVKSSLRVSAAFVPDRAAGKPDFVKGYLFARQWKLGRRLVTQGSAAFEAGVYAGITDNPGAQAAWVAAHRKAAARVPALGQRLDAHRAFTLKYAARKDDATVAGLYLTAGTTVDLVTDGPGTSPDPMGSTPLNGPGTPPPMGGLADPAQPGGASPYQGAPPLPGGPVVPDDVMGKSQQPATPDGPPAMGFSGPGKDLTNQNLAPRGPNAADEPGYSNPDAYQGDPHGSDKVAAFRNQVQANLQRMREAQSA